MNDLELSHAHTSGEVCPGCDCEVVVVLSDNEAELYVECDCGSAAVLFPLRPSPARRSAA